MQSIEFYNFHYPNSLVKCLLSNKAELKDAITDWGQGWEKREAEYRGQAWLDALKQEKVSREKNCLK